MPNRPLDRRTALRLLAGGAGAVTLGGVAAACSSGTSSGAGAKAATTARSANSTTTTTRPRKLLGPGDRPDTTKPEGADLLPEVEHIVIYMQENHSFDNYFGMLGRGDGFTLDAKGRPTNWNPAKDGTKVRAFHESDTSNSRGSGGQSWSHSHGQIDGGKMDGFARYNPNAMGYYDGTDLPYYYGLAKAFVLCDRWFCSAPAQTYPNRRFLQAATSVGITQTDLQQVIKAPKAPNGLIWERLDDHGISWADYAYDIADIMLFPEYWQANKDKIRSINQFLTDARNGTLPAVSLIGPGTTDFSEESLDSQRGEAYSRMLIDAVMHGKAWDRTVMFFTYDEHGGWYDHVPPPAAIPPDDIPLMLEPDDPPGVWDIYGPRVPSVVISPFAKKHYVSHVVHDHTSILRFIETKWNLGALTKRDANASNLLDTLDFRAKAFLEPPELPEPALPGPNPKSRFQPDGHPLPTPA